MPPESSPSREIEWRAIQEQLRELLSLHGRNGPEGDYQLIEEDLGTYEQKILVFYNDVIHPELVKSVEDLLSGYSRQWRVSMMAANKDGTEEFPPAGILVSAGGLKVLPSREISKEEDRDTRGLYASLEQLLSARGKSSAFGQGDYWIVDDGWVPRSHKVCIFKIEFLTPQLASEVQQLLRQKFSACQVWFQIEVLEPGIPIPLPGIRVFADRIERDWNREQMRVMFKDKFSW